MTRRSGMLAAMVLLALAGYRCSPGESPGGAGTADGFPPAQRDGSAPEASVRIDAGPGPDGEVYCLPGNQPDVAGSLVRLPPTGETNIFGWDFLRDHVVYGDNRCDPPLLYEVYLFHLPTLTETQLTRHPYAQWGPRLLDGQLLWTDGRHIQDLGEGQWAGYPEFYMYDISTGEDTRLTNSEQPDWGFNKFANAWTSDFLLYDSKEGVPESDTEAGFGLWLLDRHTWEKRLLSPYYCAPECPSMSDQRVVWTEYHLGPPTVDCPSEFVKDVYVHEIDTGLTYRIEESVGQCNHCPRTEGDYLVWEHSVWRPPDWHTHFELDLYRFSTGEHWLLNPDDHDQMMPAVGNGILSWADRRNPPPPNAQGFTDIYVMELATAVERRVTAGWGYYGKSKVSQGKIAYEYITPNSFSTKYLFVQDLVADGIMTPDGHVVPQAPAP